MHERLIVIVTAVRLHIVKPLSAQRDRGVGEELVDKLSVQAHGLEQLGALVGLQRGHTHLGGDLQHPRRQGFVIAFHSGLGQVLPYEGVGQVRVHRPRAVGDQHGQLVGVPGLAALQDDGDLRPLLDVDQMLLQRGDCQQRGDGQVFRVHAPVGQDQYVRPFPAGRVALVAAAICRHVAPDRRRYMLRVALVAAATCRHVAPDRRRYMLRVALKD